MNVMPGHHVKDAAEGLVYLTVRQLHARTSVAIGTLQRWAKTGLIPAYQPAGKNGKYLFPPDALERQIVASGEPAPAKPSGRQPKWRAVADEKGI